MKDIYRELMRRSLKDAHAVAEDSEVEIRNIDQFALELYRDRVLAQEQRRMRQTPEADWRDRQ